MPTEVEHKLAAILSADIVGYSRLMAEDEDETVRRLTAYRTEITNLVGSTAGGSWTSPATTSWPSSPRPPMPSSGWARLSVVF